MNRDCIIFDIDGTLANCEHRRHWITGEKKNYDKFYEEMVNDTPNEDVIWFANAIATGEDYYRFENSDTNLTFFICSGRPDNYRKQTEEWLNKYCYKLWDYKEALLMRPAGDYRPDTVIKREMLDNIRAQGYNVRLVIDDRQRVVDMWRQNSVTCLQCADSKWDTKMKCEPGRLVLLVGPSGAGKSTYLEQFGTWTKQCVVSSDQIRESLCGDFRDQSKNTQVFAALHNIVKTRIENGLLTVVDATNIKNKDRKAITALVPENTKIIYVVIDRPIEEKIRDGGWRSEVSVKGKSLIQYHHEVFYANLKDILIGDNDPRVTVDTSMLRS